MSRYSDYLLDVAGVVAVHPLNEASGTTATDIKGTSNGTYVNTPALNSAGLPSGLDSAVVFTAASSHHVTLAGVYGSTFGNGPYSFGCWFKSTASGANFAMMNLESLAGSGSEIGFGLGNLANGRVTVWDSATRIISSAALPLYNDGKWHLAIVTKIVAGNVWTMFVDGNDVTTADAAPTTATTSGVGANSRIGIAYNAGTQRWPFTGTLAYPFIANVALTLADAKALYETGINAQPGVMSKTMMKRVNRMLPGLKPPIPQNAVSQTIFATLTEAVTQSDVWTRTGTFIRTTTESVASADVWTRTIAFVRTLTESVASADVWSRIGTFKRTLTESVASADVWTRTATFLRTMTESIQSADVWTRTGTFLRTLTEAVASSDAWLGTKILVRTLTEAVASADVWTRVGTFKRTLTEAVTSADVWTRTATFLRTLTEAVTSADAWTRTATFLRTLTEAVTSSDSWTGIKVLLRTLTESVQSVDVFTRTGTFARSLTSSVTSSDAWTRLGTIKRTLTEAVTSTDVWTKGLTVIRSFTSAVTSSDAWVGAKVVATGIAASVFGWLTSAFGNYTEHETPDEVDHRMDKFYFPNDYPRNDNARRRGRR